MKYLYTLVLFAICSLTFAQSDLYVSNGSYVYVDGTSFASGPNVAPLYVTDDVNLNTNGHIYLRNDAQLLQSNATTTSTNTGAGQLSVQQTGNSNTYMYNYWASPVGQNSGTAGNMALRPNNNFYRETGAPITSTNYGFVSGYDGTATQISSYWLYSFTGLPTTTNAYEDWIGLGGGALPVGGDPNGTLAAGYGFSMKGNPSGAQKYDFRGRPNNGDITVTLNPNRETLVGNPYPSALDAYYFLHDSHNITNTTGAIKYWEQQPGATSHVLSNYVGGYGIYTIATVNDNGTPADLTDDTVTDSFVPASFRMYLLDGTVAGTPPITNAAPKTGRRYIPVGQGFMMEGSASATNVIFSNSHRVFYKQSGADSEFFKTSSTKELTDINTIPEARYTEDGYNIVPEDFKRFRINVGFDNNGNDSYTRQLLMNFHHTATAGFDYGLEAQIAEQVSSDANWILDGTPYAIQAFDYNEALKIPLLVKVNNQQLVRFGIYDIQNFASSQPIFIHDMENNLFINLQDQAYEITLEPGNYTDRFEIVFQDHSLSTEEFNDADFFIMQNNSTSQLTILNPNQLEVKTVSLFDVSGKRILNENSLSVQDRYTFSTKNLSEGIYVAKVMFANQTTTSKKVIVSQKK